MNFLEILLQTLSQYNELYCFLKENLGYLLKQLNNELSNFANASFNKVLTASP